jgi:TRAP-type transport system small permease protein
VERYLVRLEQWLLPLLALLLGFITTGVFLQIVLRYGFDTSFLWGEELSLFAFTWCVYLGAAICVRRRTHFAFDFLAGLLSGRAAAIQRLLVDLITIGIAVVLVVDGWSYAQLSIQRLSPALGITLFVPTIIIPISGALMIMAVIPHAVLDCRLLLTGRHD